VENSQAEEQIARETLVHEVVKPNDTDPKLNELEKLKEELMKEIERQRIMHDEELKKQKEDYEKEMRRQHAEFMDREFQKQRQQKEEMERRERERVEAEIRQAEKIAELQRIKMEQEEKQKKAAEELDRARKLREEKAAKEKKEREEAERAVQQEKIRLRRERAKAKEQEAANERSEGPEVRIPVINAVPIAMVLPKEAPMQDTYDFSKIPPSASATTKDPKQMWEDILKEHGSKPTPYSETNDPYFRRSKGGSG
jgi:hypothetical protein